MMAFPMSSPRIAAKGTLSTPTSVTLLGSFFLIAAATSIPIKLVPMMTMSASLEILDVMALVSATNRIVCTFFKSLPSMGSFFGLPPGAMMR